MFSPGQGESWHVGKGGRSWLENCSEPPNPSLICGPGDHQAWRLSLVPLAQPRPGTGRGDQETDTGRRALGTRKAAACRSRLRGSVALKGARGSAPRPQQQTQQQSSQSRRSAHGSIPAPRSRRPAAAAPAARFLFRFLGSSPSRVCGAGAAEPGAGGWRVRRGFRSVALHVGVRLAGNLGCSLVFCGSIRHITMCVLVSYPSRDREQSLRLLVPYAKMWTIVSPSLPE